MLENDEICLISDLVNNDPHIRLRATMSLRGIGPRAHEAVSQLTANLQDSSLDVIRASMIALGAIGYRAESALRRLIDIMHRTDEINEFVASSMADVLGGLLPPLTDVGFDVAKELGKALSHRNESIRYAAAFGLHKLFRNRGVALKPLVNALGDTSSSVRYWASASLQEMGSEILPELEKIMPYIEQDDENMSCNLIDAVSACHAQNPTLRIEILRKINPVSDYLKSYLEDVIVSKR